MHPAFTTLPLSPCQFLHLSARVETTSGSIEVGVEQVQWLCKARQAAAAMAVDVIVADGHYGNHHFFGPLRQESCALLARLRCDRVLYGPPGSYKGGGRRTSMTSKTQKPSCPSSAPYPTLFAMIGTPAAPPQTRRNGSGWPKGKPRQQKKRYKPVKRSRLKPKKK